MTEVVLSGEVLSPGAPPPTASGLQAVDGGVLEQLRREWLIGYGPKHTRGAYDGDLSNWLAFLDRSGVDPLTAEGCRLELTARGPAFVGGADEAENPSAASAETGSSLVAGRIADDVGLPVRDLI